MSRLQLLGVAVRLGALELARQPAYLIPTMLFPSMFFVFFAVPELTTTTAANYATASFAAFAVFGVVMFQFGVGLAVDRASPWSTFLRVMPVERSVQLFARVLTALLFAAVTAGPVIVIGSVATPVDLGVARWIAVGGALVTGAIPLSLLGIWLGYATSSKAAVPLANLLYLPLSFGGGLWIPPELLPGWVQIIGPWMPTRHWASLIAAAVAGRPWHPERLFALGAFVVLFGMGAAIAYRRDEGKKYR